MAAGLTPLPPALGETSVEIELLSEPRDRFEEFVRELDNDGAAENGFALSSVSPYRSTRWEYAENEEEEDALNCWGHRNFI